VAPRHLRPPREIGGENPGLAFDEHLAKVGADNLWVAEDDGRIVGLAGLIPGDQPELEPIVVASDRRGDGIGRLLAAKVVETARARGARTVQVRPVGRDVEAIRFFHRLGFDIVAHVQLQ
jgi:N-acetylglutamate synthase-like GNAT family acetyltransferase